MYENKHCRHRCDLLSTFLQRMRGRQVILSPPTRSSIAFRGQTSMSRRILCTSIDTSGTDTQDQRCQTLARPASSAIDRPTVARTSSHHKSYVPTAGHQIAARLHLSGEQACQVTCGPLAGGATDRQRDRLLALETHPKHFPSKRLQHHHPTTMS